MVDALIRLTKDNCNISDAAHWGSFSICGLLMRYRDLYRSELGLSPWSPIDRREIAAWIDRKESLWPSLEGQDFRDLTFCGRTFPPLAGGDLNRSLESTGHVYGAGYGMYLKPTFFLARIRSIEEIDGHRVYTTDRELARDLFTSPAMLLDRTIFLRMAPLRSLLWDLYTQVRPGCATVLAHAFDVHGIRAGMAVSDDLAARFERMMTDFLPILLRHELAESREALPSWKEVLSAAGDRAGEQYLRAVQDLVADTSDAGPLKRMIDDRNAGALALFLGLLDGFRRELYPEIRQAGRSVHGDGDWQALEDVRQQGHLRFRELRREVTELFGHGDRGTFTLALRDLVRRVAHRPAAA